MKIDGIINESTEVPLKSIKVPIYRYPKPSKVEEDISIALCHVRNFISS